MNREYHWFESFEDLYETVTKMNKADYPTIACGYHETYAAIKNEMFNIYSDQSTYFAQPTLDRGYHLFAHFKNGKTVEIYRGKEVAGRTISDKDDLEKLLLDGAFRA